MYRQIALIIEDDAFYAEIVAAMLLQQNFDTVRCFNYEDALSTKPDPKIKLTLCDIFMEGIGGIQGIKMLRERFPDIKIVAMSGGVEGMGSDDTLRAALKVGADSGLLKPFTADQLREQLESLELVEAS